MSNDFTKYLQKIIDDLKTKDLDLVFTTLFPVDSERYFHNCIGKKHNSEKIRAFLKNDLANIYRHQDSFNIAIMHKALQNNCKILDIRTPLLQKVDFLGHLSNDGIHPNSKGQRIIAETAINFIENYGK